MLCLDRNRSCLLPDSPRLHVTFPHSTPIRQGPNPLKTSTKKVLEQTGHASELIKPPKTDSGPHPIKTCLRIVLMLPGEQGLKGPVPLHRGVVCLYRAPPSACQMTQGPWLVPTTPTTLPDMLQSARPLLDLQVTLTGPDSLDQCSIRSEDPQLPYHRPDFKDRPFFLYESQKRAYLSSA